jgi:hypothetical protein
MYHPIVEGLKKLAINMEADVTDPNFTSEAQEPNAQHGAGTFKLGDVIETINDLLGAPPQHLVRAKRGMRGTIVGVRKNMSPDFAPYAVNFDGKTYDWEGYHSWQGPHGTDPDYEWSPGGGLKIGHGSWIYPTEIKEIRLVSPSQTPGNAPTGPNQNASPQVPHLSAELDKIADEIQKEAPEIALHIDRISDFLENRTAAKDIKDPPVENGGFDIVRKVFEKQRTTKRPTKHFKEEKLN